MFSTFFGSLDILLFLIQGFFIKFHQISRVYCTFMTNLLPPDSDSEGSEGEEQSTGMQSKKVPSSPEIANWI